MPDYSSFVCLNVWPFLVGLDLHITSFQLSLSTDRLPLSIHCSECPSGKKGGDLGWFPRGKMAGPFQEVAFNTPVGATSAPFKSLHMLLYIKKKTHTQASEKGCYI